MCPPHPPPHLRLAALLPTPARQAPARRPTGVCAAPSPGEVREVPFDREVSCPSFLPIISDSLASPTLRRTPGEAINVE